MGKLHFFSFFPPSCCTGRRRSLCVSALLRPVSSGSEIKLWGLYWVEQCGWNHAKLFLDTETDSQAQTRWLWEGARRSQANQPGPT